MNWRLKFLLIFWWKCNKCLFFHQTVELFFTLDNLNLRVSFTLYCPLTRVVEFTVYSMIMYYWFNCIVLYIIEMDQDNLIEWWFQCPSPLFHHLLFPKQLWKDPVLLIFADEKKETFSVAADLVKQPLLAPWLLSKPYWSIVHVRLRYFSGFFLSITNWLFSNLFLFCWFFWKKTQKFWQSVSLKLVWIHWKGCASTFIVVH